MVRRAMRVQVRYSLLIAVALVLLSGAAPAPRDKGEKEPAGPKILAPVDKAILSSSELYVIGVAKPPTVEAPLRVDDSAQLWEPFDRPVLAARAHPARSQTSSSETAMASSLRVIFLASLALSDRALARHMK